MEIYDSFMKSRFWLNGFVYSTFSKTAIGRKQTIGAKRKATPKDGFGNAFGNKGVVSLQTLVIPIDMAERTGLEPATLGVTGRYSNQLNYRSKYKECYLCHFIQLAKILASPGGFEPPYSP